MDQADRHIYLYAKGHYQKSDMVEDMKVLLCERSGSKHITTEDIIIVLSSLVYPYIENQYRFRHFLADLDPESYWKWQCDISDQYTFQKALISKCLAVLSMVKVMEGKKVIMDLGNPDSGVLPIKVYNGD